MPSWAQVFGVQLGAATHMPAEQVSPALHPATQHGIAGPPQLPVPPSLPPPVGLQVPPKQAVPAPHTAPQAPQLFESYMLLTHAAPHAVLEGPHETIPPSVGGAHEPLVHAKPPGQK